MTPEKKMKLQDAVRSAENVKRDWEIASEDLALKAKSHLVAGMFLEAIELATTARIERGKAEAMALAIQFMKSVQDDTAA